MDLKKLADQYKDELLDNVLPFWLEHSQDHEHGGYFTCLDRKGNVFDTDKFIWLQGREVWLYNPQIQISAESETKRSIFREKDKTKRSKKESAQHSKSRNKSFVMTSVSAL